MYFSCGVEGNSSDILLEQMDVKKKAAFRCANVTLRHQTDCLLPAHNQFLLSALTNVNS